MQYIRFLKSPRFTSARSGHQGKVSAIITITSDLGESFYARDVDLTARLLDDTASRRSLPILASRHHWRSHMTHLKIELDVTIQPKGALHHRVTLAVSSDQTAADKICRPIGGNSEILSAYSSPLELASGAVAERFVQRVLEIGCGEVLPIWEEMGESIYGHIWDGGLALAAHLAENYRIPNGEAKELGVLQKKLRSSEKLEILELGSGLGSTVPSGVTAHRETHFSRCGIVGLAVASLSEHFHVTMSDLPLAQELISKNLQGTGCGRNVAFEVLDWGEEIPQRLIAIPLDLIVVSDCTYNVSSAPSLVRMLSRLATRSPNALCLLAHKQRHDSEKVFFQLMNESFKETDKIQKTLGDVIVDIYTFEFTG